jgi:hypothetical protein
MLKCGDWGIGDFKICKIFTNAPRGFRKMDALYCLTGGIVKRTFGIDV